MQAKRGQPPRNCSVDYEHMVGNMTLVKDHPATWGYCECHPDLEATFFFPFPPNAGAVSCLQGFLGSVVSV